MGSGSDKLAKIMQAAASNVFDGKTMSDLLFATITSVDPIKIMTESALEMGEGFITVSQHLTDYYIDCEITTNEISGFYTPDVHPGNHDIKVTTGLQKGKILLKNKLKVGDKVIVGKSKTNQMYIILDRIAEEGS